MYTYKETHDGVTRYSLRAWNRHGWKLGQVTHVTAHKFTAPPSKTRPWTRTGIRVVLHGTKGTMTLPGVNWGYGGEGPSGLRYILGCLGIAPAAAERLALEHDTALGEWNPDRHLTPGAAERLWTIEIKHDTMAHKWITVRRAA